MQVSDWEEQYYIDSLRRLYDYSLEVSERVSSSFAPYDEITVYEVKIIAVKILDMLDKDISIETIRNAEYRFRKLNKY